MTEICKIKNKFKINKNTNFEFFSNLNLYKKIAKKISFKFQILQK